MSAGALWVDVLRHLWQPALVVLPLFVVARVLRMAPARWSHRLWLAALAKLFLPLALFGPWAGAALRLAEAHGAASVGGLPGFQVLVRVIGADGASASSSLAERLPPPFWIVCTVVYAGIACVLLLRTGRDLAAARRLTQFSVSLSEHRAARLASGLAHAGLPGDRVVISESNSFPAVAGTLRPHIVLPLRLIDELDKDELAAVLLPEEMHRRHADPAIALVQRLTTCLLFYFPLLAPLQRRLREAAEMRCDEGAPRAGAQPAAYTRALARTVQLALDPSPAPAALGDGSPSLVSRRIDRLQEPGRICMRPKHRIALGFAVALLAAGVFLPVAPPGLMAGTDQPGSAQLDPNVTIPEVIHRVAALYPKDAMAARAEGLVVVVVMVGSDGAVRDVQVKRHVEGWPSFDQAAIDAVRQFTFKPAMKSGVAIDMQTRVAIEFRLRKNADGTVAAMQ
jgi:TonB family protein